MPTGDLIDQAIDEAQSSLDTSSSQETSEPSTSSPETKEDLIETSEIQKAIEKSDKEQSSRDSSKKRDNSGKFTKTEKVEQQVAAPEQTDLKDQEANAELTPEGAQQTVATPSVNPPAFWSADKKALFTKVPPELQPYIAERELLFQQQMSRTANEMKRSKDIEQRYNEVFSEPQRLRFQAEGLKDGFEAASRLLAWNELFEKDPKTGIADLMRKNGLTPYDFAEDNSQPSHETQVNDPRIEEALERAERAEKRFEEWQKQQSEAEIDREYQSFKQSKDSLGQTRAQFCDVYEPQIADAIKAIKGIDPQMSRADVLNHAYEYVLGEVRKLHGSVTPSPVTHKPEAIAAQSQKARAASGSVTGAPSNGMAVTRPRLKGNNFDEQFDSAYEIAMAKHASY